MGRQKHFDYLDEVSKYLLALDGIVCYHYLTLAVVAAAAAAATLVSVVETVTYSTHHPLVSVYLSAV